MSFSAVVRSTAFVLIAGVSLYAFAQDRATTTSGTSSPTPAAATTLSAGKPRPTHAVGKLVCDKKTYLMSTGTGSGSCVSGVGSGDCQDGGNTSSATCSGGCGTSTGKGTCTEQ